MTSQRELPAPNVAAALQSAAQAYALDVCLLRAVAWVESRFNPRALGPITKVGGWRAMGLMQLGPIARTGLTDPFDPSQNALAAAKLLAGYFQQYKGDIRLTLGAYNWGPGNLDKAHGQLPASVKLYVDLVLERRTYEQARAALPPPPSAAGGKP